MLHISCDHCNSQNLCFKYFSIKKFFFFFYNFVFFDTFRLRPKEYKFENEQPKISKINMDNNQDQNHVDDNLLRSPDLPPRNALIGQVNGPPLVNHDVVSALRKNYRQITSLSAGMFNSYIN